jgi:serine/threonine protein kinase/uncharacterized membrane protein
MSDRSGQHLGNYRLLRLLGQGGFADVYLAEHRHLGTYAAVKVLSMRLTRDHVDQFFEEARLLARLVHPHIVRMLDFGLEGNTAYLIMEYAPHGTLRHRHPKGATLPLPTVVSYTRQVAEALKFAHDRKLIHRDIKPENMLVGDQQEILLSDFGIALISQSSHNQDLQGISGTVAYMAPEQLQGKPRRASDQYALGVVVYEWLCGERPFHGSFIELFSQHLNVPPPSLLDRLPALPASVERVIFRALAKEAELRFPSIQHFAAALEEASSSAFTTQEALIPDPPRTITLAPIPSAPPALSVQPPAALPAVTASVASSVPLTRPLGINTSAPPPDPAPAGIREAPARSGVWLRPLPFILGVAFTAGITLFALYTSFNASPVFIPGVIVLISLGAIVPLFFGAAFGPWVGFFTGAFGSLLGTDIAAQSIHWNHALGIALMGAITGFTVHRTNRHFRHFPSMVFVLCVSSIAILVGVGLSFFSDIWLGFSSASVASVNYLTSAFPMLLVNLILLPLLLLAYDFFIGARRQLPAPGGRAYVQQD